jgi:uncharacterized membrane protein YfcA
MARIGARTVHKIDKNKISKLLGIFLLLVAVKFFYEYLKIIIMHLKLIRNF